MTYRKNGGIWFVRIGRFGGSFHIARRPARPMTEWQIALCADRWLVRATVLAVGSMLINHAL